MQLRKRGQHYHNILSYTFTSHSSAFSFFPQMTVVFLAQLADGSCKAIYYMRVPAWVVATTCLVEGLEERRLVYEKVDVTCF